MDFLREVNDRVDLNIIVSTGIYTFDHLPAPHRLAVPVHQQRRRHPHQDVPARSDHRRRRLGRPRAVHQDRGGQGGFTPNIERIFRAAGKASSETGAPITVHTHPADRQAAQALEILTSEGADPRTVVIGRSGDTTDVDYLRSIIDAGAIVGSDRFGLYLIPGTASEDERIDVLADPRRGGEGRPRRALARRRPLLGLVRAGRQRQGRGSQDLGSHPHQRCRPARTPPSAAWQTPTSRR